MIACFLFFKFPHLPMEVVIKVTNRYCDETQRRQEIVICLDAFLCQQFLTIQTLLALRCIEM